MIRVFTHTISIARRPEQVFDFFVDFSQAPRWRQYVRTMRVAGDGPLRAGSTIHVTMDLLGESYDVDLEVLECRRPTLWRHRTNESDFSGFIEYRFDSEGDTTRVTMTMEVKPKGLYGWFAMPLMFLRREKPYADQLPQLKRALEAGTQ
jgi:uncharacterized membrane protein